MGNLMQDCHEKSSIQQEDCFHHQMALICKQKIRKGHIFSLGFYGAEIWTLWKIDEKYLQVLKCGSGE
jgi:hypothetical protein